MLGMARLMQLYKSRFTALVERRKCLLQMQEASAPDSAASANVLAELERLQREYSFVALAFPNALYSRIMEPWQVRLRLVTIRMHACKCMRVFRSMCEHMQKLCITACRWQESHVDGPLHTPHAASIPSSPLLPTPSCCPTAQACSVWVASYPYIPSLMVLDKALESLLAASDISIPAEPPGGTSGEQQHHAVPQVGTNAWSPHTNTNNSSY